MYLCAFIIASISMHTRILILNASPRREGNLSAMLHAMAEEARRWGAVAEEVRVADLTVRPCTGCMACRSRLECVLPEDDAQRVLAQIKACDVLVIGAPCYWGNMPGTLKVLFDRMVYGLMGEGRHGMPRPLHKGKQAVVVSTSTTPWPFNIWFRQTRGTVRALREILRWSGFRVVKTIERGGTRQKPVGEKDLARCRRAVSKALNI